VNRKDDEELTMLLQKLKSIRADLDAVIAGLDTETPAPVFERKPLPAHAKAAYDACKALWSAAQSDYNKGNGWLKPDGLPFTIFDYVPGLQIGGVTRKPPKSATEMQTDITALGFVKEGVAWLSHAENSSQLDPDYQRHFLGYVTVRRNQNDDQQGFTRVP
jgi:hypothetical protein